MKKNACTHMCSWFCLGLADHHGGVAAPVIYQLAVEVGAVCRRL